MVKHHPIMYVGMAKDVERVRWLLEHVKHRADLEARGNWGSAADHAATTGSEEMKRAIEEIIWVRRSVHGPSGKLLVN